MSKCPNKNDKEYKALSAIVGDGKAHTIYAKNNGNPVSLTADGNPSLIYQQLVERYGVDKAVKYRANMFTEKFSVLSGQDTTKIKNGVDQLFNDNDKLSTIGTKQQYSKYIESIFPDSKNKEILFRGENENNKNGKYFTPDENYAKVFGKNVKPFIINSNNVLDLRKYNIELDAELIDKSGRETERENLWVNKNIDIDKLIDNSDTVVGLDAGNQVLSIYTKNDVYQLGSELDITGFKKFVAKNTISENDYILDENDNIITKSGKSIQIGEKVAETEGIKDYKLRKEFIATAEKTNSFIHSLEKAVPGFKIQVESFETTRNTEHATDRAWVDATGIHLNTQSMNVDTPIHELTHVWIHVLEMTDGYKYNQFMSKVRDSIADNKEIMDSIRKKYWQLDEVHQLYEYAAAVSGMTSQKEVNKFLARNNRYVSSIRSKDIFRKVYDIVSSLFSSIGNLVSGKITANSALDNVNFEKGTLNDIFNALTEDILNGRKIIDFGPVEVEQLLKNYYSDGFYEADIGFKPIENVAEVVPFLINNEEYGQLNFENPEAKEKMVENIFANLWQRDKDRIYVDYGKMYSYPNSMPDNEVMASIKNEMLVRRQQMMNSFNNNIVEILNKHISDTSVPLETLIQDTFSEYGFSDTVVENIVRSIKLLGINEPMTTVMNYRDMTNVQALAPLYNDAIVGFNPIVIVHTMSDSKVDVSLIDLTGSVLGFQDNLMDSHKKSLASNLGNDKSEKGRKFNMSNSQGDIRQVLLGVTIAGMNKLAQENNKKLTLRRYGVIGFNGTSIQPRMLSTLHQAMANGRDLFTLPSVQAVMDEKSLSYKWFQELLSDDKAWNEDSIYQSWRDKLETYYAAYYQSLNMDEVQKNAMTDNFNSYEHFKLLSDRARAIEIKDKNWINNPEHKLITQYLVWFKQGVGINNGQVKDINKTWLKFTNIHNIKSDILQYYSVEAEATKSIIVNQLNDYKAKFNDALTKSLESRGMSLNILGNQPEKVFGHLFKKGELLLTEDSDKNKKGDIVPIILNNQLYGSYNVEEAKKAGLTTEDIALADLILETVKERYLANAMHDNSRRSTPKKEEELRNELLSKMVPGHIPVLEKTKQELFRDKKYKEMVRKGWDQIAISEFMSGIEDVTIDNDLISDDYQHMNSRFRSQQSIQQQMIRMGLMPTDSTTPNRYKGDLKFYGKKTMNLEYVFNMFVDDSIRTIEIENRMIPAMNKAIQWNQILKEEYNIQTKYTNEFLKEYSDRIIKGKSQDDPTDKTAAIVKNITNAYSFMALGYRPLVWVRSAYFNTQSQIIEALSTKAANMFTDENKRLNFPTPEDMTKANLELAMNHKKVMALGKKFGLVNGSEMEAIESFFTTNIDKNVFQSQLAHIGNYYSDIAARLTTMVGFMIHDGSYEAHTYDKTTDTLKYDKLKDTRYFDKEGKMISGKEQAIWDRKTKQMIDQGIIKDTENMEVGYDFEEVNTRFKWYADKYIIGAMDEYQKMLLGNTFSGRIFTQFRTFLPGKIFNLVGSRRMTSYGADVTAELNENNEWETIKKQIMIEGTLASMWNYLSDVVKVVRTKDMKFSDLEEMDPMTKYNLARSMISATFFTSILVGINMLAANGMSDRDKDKLSWLYSELLSYSNYDSIKSNIVPMSGLIDNIMGLMTGQKKWTRLFAYTGPVYDAIWFMELLGDNDNMLQDWTARKKINDMNAQELKEHYQEVADKRAKRLQKEVDDLEKLN